MDIEKLKSFSDYKGYILTKTSKESREVDYQYLTSLDNPTVYTRKLIDRLSASTNTYCKYKLTPYTLYHPDDTMYFTTLKGVENFLKTVN